MQGAKTLDPHRRAGGIAKAIAFAAAGLGALLVAQWGYALYSRGEVPAAFALGMVRGSAVFALVFGVGAVIGFGILGASSASIADAAVLGAVSAIPVALLGAGLAGSLGLPAAAGAIALSAALIAYVGGGGLRKR